MIRIIVLGILILIATSNSIAQGPGPHFDRNKSPSNKSKHYMFKDDNLSKLSQDELVDCLGYAKRMKRGGYVITGAGLAMYGSVILQRNSIGLDAAIGILIAGTGFLIVGIPVSITNASRAKRVRAFMSSSDQVINIRLSPHLNYNQYSSSYQPGISLVISF